jgi:hypothetical protein
LAFEFSKLVKTPFASSPSPPPVFYWFDKRICGAALMLPVKMTIFSEMLRRYSQFSKFSFGLHHDIHFWDKPYRSKLKITASAQWGNKTQICVKGFVFFVFIFEGLNSI